MDKEYKEYKDWCFNNKQFLGRMFDSDGFWNFYLKQTLTQQRTELLNNILEENHCDLDGTYDYDGIAETVIKLCKKL